VKDASIESEVLSDPCVLVPISFDNPLIGEISEPVMLVLVGVRSATAIRWSSSALGKVEGEDGAADMCSM